MTEREPEDWDDGTEAVCYCCECGLFPRMEGEAVCRGCYEDEIEDHEVNSRT